MNNTSSSELSSSNTCANCGKEGSDVTNTCNKCKSVMYCNAACKKKHRHKHKKECERRVAELHDEKLFKQPPPMDDCPICMIRLPTLETGTTYMSCCGKVICRGCTHAPVYDDQGNEVDNQKCPFCRTAKPNTYDEYIERCKKRAGVNDSSAFHDLGYCYLEGQFGLPQNTAKALELFHRAGELGCAAAYGKIGFMYELGEGGVERDEKKSDHYNEMAAIAGDVDARNILGIKELKAGNVDRALKHYTIAATDGDINALNGIKGMYLKGYATKDDYAKAVTSYQAYLNEVKSDQRDKAAAAKDTYEYYGSLYGR